MTVPAAPTYSAAALVAAHESIKALIDGATTAGKLRLRDASDNLLADVALSDPCGTVNGTSGQLSITPANGTASGTGQAAYGEICDGDGAVVLALPAVQSSVAVSGRVALQTVNVVAGSPVSIYSITIG